MNSVIKHQVSSKCALFLAITDLFIQIIRIMLHESDDEYLSKNSKLRIEYGEVNLSQTKAFNFYCCYDAQLS